MEITKEEYSELKSHSLMLGQIGCYIENFCNEEDTALDGVIRLLAEYYSIKSLSLYEKLDNSKCDY
jgi:hypothetical protein